MPPSPRHPSPTVRRPPVLKRLPRALSGALLAALLSTALLGAGQPEPQDATSGRSGTGEEIVWSMTPAPQAEGDGADDAADADRVSFRFGVAPGETVEDAVEITNHSNREITYDLTASDGVIGSSGAFDMLPPDVESERTGTWIELAEDSVTIASGETAQVPFTLTVPENATPGDHPGGIASSVSPEDAADEQVSTVARVGTRVHLRVDGEIQPLIDLRDLELEYEQNWNPFAPGTLTARWTAQNSGNVRLGSEQDLTVAGPFGWFAEAEPATEIRELLPGQVVELEMTTEAWPLFTTGGEVTSTPSVVGEDTVDAELQRSSTSVNIMTLPVPQLILLVLIGLLVWWLVVRRRRRKAKFEESVQKAAAERIAGETTEVPSGTGVTAASGDAEADTGGRVGASASAQD